MANDIIKKHNFELAKNSIKSLALQIPPSVSLESFPTDGSFWGFTSHNVTGEEINKKLLKPLREKLIDQNEHLRKLYKTADEVYKALDSLDKEYVSGIVGTAEAAALASDQALTASGNAQKASNQALAASSQALDASKKATTAQADIKRTIEALQTTVRILKEFKEKVTKDLSSIVSLNTRITSVNSKIQNVENMISDVADSAKKIKDFQHIFSNLNHIKDVDQIWNDLKNSREVVKGLIDTLTPFMSRVNDSDKELHGEINKISTLLESYQHLGDVDAIWSDVEGHKTNLASFHQQVDAFVEKVNQATARIDGDIEVLKQYRTLLESYQHLGDVDAIWSDVEGHKTNLASFHQQVDAFVEKVNQATARIDGDIEALKQYRTLLESYQHLGDVDAIWSDVEGHKTDLASFHQQVDAFVEKVNQATARIDGDIEALKQYRTLLESYQHLGDVDAIWSDVEGHKTDLSSFHQQVDAFVEKVNQATARIDGDIEALKQYRTLLESYQHLGDVDAIWSDVKGHKTDLLGLHEKFGEFIEETHLGLERIEGLIHQFEEDNYHAHLQYNKKIKVAFWLGGSAVGLIVINYILQIIGVL